MPELPEVETMARDLAPLVEGAEITAAWWDWPAVIRHPDPEAFARRLAATVDARLDDAVQHAFVTAFDRLDTYDPSHRFFSWVYRIALNESINWLKKSNRQQTLDYETADQGDGPETMANDQQLGEGMEAAMMRIGDDYRAVIILKHVLGCSYIEISEVLDISEKKVKSRLYTARQLLQERLTQQGLH